MEPDDTVLPAPNRIMELGRGFMAAKALFSAVELGVFAELAAGPLDAEALRRRLGLHERGARDFFDALVALRLLDRGPDGVYANAPDSDFYLDRGKPTYLGGILEMANARLYGFWGALTEALRTGRPQNEARGGGDAFAAIYADPGRLAAFLGAMTGISRPVAAALARRFPWRDRRSFADIGTAEGALPLELARAHPHLRGIGFDLPAVAPLFERQVRAHRLADRLRYVAGDFLADPLPSAEVLVMGHILHDWDLATKRLLLAKAHAALPPGGALIVYDQMIDDERRENAAGLLMSLNMLIETPGGFDYTGADCRRWMGEAGFRSAAVEPLVGAYSIAVGTR
jgi:precorrin-6B methylase 2